MYSTSSGGGFLPLVSWDQAVTPVYIVLTAAYSIQGKELSFISASELGTKSQELPVRRLEIMQVQLVKNGERIEIFSDF